MQTRQHEDTFGAQQLERYQGADKAAGAEPDSGAGGAGEGELCRYDEEEIATQPWPPVHG
jgi:hypothetical protein